MSLLASLGQEAIAPATTGVLESSLMAYPLMSCGVGSSEQRGHPFLGCLACGSDERGLFTGFPYLLCESRRCWRLRQHLANLTFQLQWRMLGRRQGTRGLALPISWHG